MSPALRDGEGFRLPRAVLVTALLALAVKLVLAATTHGTNDIRAFWYFLQEYRGSGAKLLYEKESEFNHPLFVLLSLVLLDRSAPTWAAGIAMGMAVNMKTVPLMFWPAVCLWLPSWRRRVEYFGAAVAVIVLASAPLIFQEPALLARKVLGYPSSYGLWGTSRILTSGESLAPASHAFETYGRVLLAATLVGLAIWMNRGPVRPPLFRQIGVLTFAFLSVTPGFGVQYLAWLVPWIAGIECGFALAWCLASGAFLSLVYTFWCQDVPFERGDPNWLGANFWLRGPLGATPTRMRWAGGGDRSFPSNSCAGRRWSRSSSWRCARSEAQPAKEPEALPPVPLPRAGRALGILAAAIGPRRRYHAPRMRVLFLTDSLSDLDGVGRYTVRLLTALEKARPDLDFQILLARKHRPTSADVPARWKVTVALPPDYFVRMWPPLFWASLLASSLRVARAARGADLVHAIKDFPHSLAGLLGARLRGVPCVATAHGTYSVQPLLTSRHRQLARWTYRHLAGLISVSGFTRDRLLGILGEHGLPRSRVIPNAVSVGPYAIPSTVGPRPWHGQAYTLSIGEIKERKGHHLAIAAFCRAAAYRPELHHYVVGKGSADAYEAGLRETVRAAGLESRVHFLGNVEEVEKIDLLQRARLFLLTPVTAADGGFEGFGLVYLEAAACGVPAIGTRGCGAEDAIVDGETGLLVEPRVEAVVAALERLLSDAALARELGEKARRRAQASSWEENARNVLAFYEEVLARQETPPAGVG